jgi:hypothetical protein
MNIQSKVTGFESRYKKLDRDSLYGQVDDMELLEWEGEIETIDRLRKKISALKCQQGNAGCRKKYMMCFHLFQSTVRS